MQQLVISILPICFVVLGVGVTIYGFQVISAARRAETWPSTNGLIEESNIIEHEFSDNVLSYCPSVTYSYSVNGKLLCGTSIAFGLKNSYSNWAFANRYVQLYPIGKKVCVFYDAMSPTRSVLENDISTRRYIPLAIGLVFILAGIFFGKIFEMF